MVKSKNNLIMVTIMLAVALFIGTAIVYADDMGALDASDIHITGTHKVTNNDSFDTVNHTFILSAKDVLNPMPAGSDNGKKTITVGSNSDFDFGSIDFPQKGVYEYTVSREKIQCKSLNMDESSYDVQIAVFADGTAVMITKKTGDTVKMDKIEYLDTYQETSVLTFKLNGGEMDGITTEIHWDEVNGEYIIMPEGPYKEGYKFLYWQGSKYYPGDKYYVEGDHVFTAVYEKLKDEETKPTNDNDSDSSSDSSSNSSSDDSKHDRDRGTISDFVAKTGDNLPVLLIFALMFISIIVITVVVLIKKKPNKSLGGNINDDKK